MPSFSTRPGGNTRDAKARRKMELNSESRPPIPMSSNLKFGAKIALGAALSNVKAWKKNRSQEDVLLGAGLYLDGTISRFDKSNISFVH